MADITKLQIGNDELDITKKQDKMAILSYGHSTWSDFIDVYQKNAVVYCRASSNSNPATGSQTRMAFMAYVNNADNPTEVEFQYVRSVSNKIVSQPVDQVFVYKLTSASGGTWTVTTRDMGPKLAHGTNTTVSYSNGTYTISATQPTVNNATLTIQKNGTTVKTFTANASSNVTANITVPTTVAELSDSSTYITQSNLTTQLANKQNVLTAGDHINITDSTIKAIDYVHSEQPVATSAVTPVVTNNMIADGSITADKLASGATVKLTLSTSDIGEGAALAANTLYGVYQ